MYSPHIHQEIARQRQVDMLREAKRERRAAVAAASNGGSRLGWARTLMASFATHAHRRPESPQPAVSSAT